MRLIDFDPVKNAHNIAKHGIALTEVEHFDWGRSLLEHDQRRDYGERRYIATGMIGDRLHVVVFTQRGNCVRIISLRKANSRERKRYEEAIYGYSRGR